MKRLSFKIILSLFAATAACGAWAQQQDFGPKWGATPEEQQQNVMNYNFFTDACKNKNWEEAASFIPGLLQGAPQSTGNLYIYAADVFDNRILRATSVEKKNELIDSLMLIYDLRMANFGDQNHGSPARVLPLKADAYRTYKPADRAGIRKIYREAIDALGNDVDVDFVNVYFNELTSDYKADEIEVAEYMDEYTKLEQIVKDPKNAENVDAANTFEALFITSGAADCENLVELFRPRIAAAPDDVDEIKKALQYLLRGNCKGGDFFGEVAVKYHELDPSTESAMMLAEYYESRKEFGKALQYLREAISNEQDPQAKLNLCIRIAGSELGAGNSRNAADFARQAISIDSESGLAHYFLAQAYVSGTNQCSGFDRQAAYWIVYDALQSAKRFIKPGDPIKTSDIDAQMGSFRNSFPTAEECFFRGLNNGDSYRVNCGIVSGNATVRTR